MVKTNNQRHSENEKRLDEAEKKLDRIMGFFWWAIKGMAAALVTLVVYIFNTSKGGGQ